MAHPLSAAAQKLLHARQSTRQSSMNTKVPTNTKVKETAPTDTFTAVNPNLSDRMHDSSVFPDGTKAPKAKRSTKAARDPQGQDPQLSDPGNFQEKFADGGYAEGGMETAGARSGFKGPKNMRPVRGGNTPKAKPFVPTEEMRTLPAETKPPPFTQNAPETADVAGGAEEPFSALERDLPKGQALEGPAAGAAEGEGLSGVEEAGIKALIRKYAPEVAGGALMSSAAAIPIAAMSDLATNSTPAGEGEAQAVAEQNQRAKTNQHLLAQDTAPGSQSGALLMAAHGSDADKALAQEFLKHVKKNFSHP